MENKNGKATKVTQVRGCEMKKKPVTIVDRCYSCGGYMDGRKEDYRYVECGLNTVTLKNILVFRCKDCRAIVPQISAAHYLHRLIGFSVLMKGSLLSGAEVKFLRRLLRYSVTELAKLAGTSKSVVSRWENHSTFGKDSDRLLRLILAHKMLRDVLAEVQANHDDRFPQLLFTIATRLTGQMEQTLKTFQDRTRRVQIYVIDPMELNAYSDSADVTSVTEIAPSVQ